MFLFCTLQNKRSFFYILKYMFCFLLLCTLQNKHFFILSCILQTKKENNNLRIFTDALFSFVMHLTKMRLSWQVRARQSFNYTMKQDCRERDVAHRSEGEMCLKKVVLDTQHIAVLGQRSRKINPCLNCHPSTIPWNKLVPFEGTGSEISCKTLGDHVLVWGLFISVFNAFFLLHATRVNAYTLALN